jgi:hypothetical protein
MNVKTLTAAAAAAAFAFAVHAADNNKAAPGSASAGASQKDGGAEAMFKALDKDKDGAITKAEAKGTPHEKDFDKLDKNRDGKLSRQEHAAAPEHAGKADSSAGASSKPGQKPKY